MQLTSRQRQHLKGLAHPLRPVVQIGKDGISPAVVKQVRDALDRHELIKVKLTDAAPLGRGEASDALPAAVGAALVQNVGRVFVLYRPHPDAPRIVLPIRSAVAELSVEEDPGASLEDLRAPKPLSGPAVLGSVRERGPRAVVPPPIVRLPPTPPQPLAHRTDSRASRPRVPSAPRRRPSRPRRVAARGQARGSGRGRGR